MPDFLIIGAQKAGTTSLFHYLSQHPDICVPAKKEIHYYDINYHKGLSWYKRFFALQTTNKLVGEATPYYLFHPDVPRRVAADVPNVKLIVCLRDPTQRAFSHYQMMKRLGIEYLSFEEAIRQEPTRYKEGLRELATYPLKQSHNHQHFTYLSRGKYARQLRRWYKYFPRQQFLIISSDDLASNTTQVLTRVYEFLGVRVQLPADTSFKNQGDFFQIEPAMRTSLQQYFDREKEEVRQLIRGTFGQ